MKRHGTARQLSTLFFLFAALAYPTAAQGPLGTATLSGPVRVDGQVATGSVSVGNASRISTGDGATVQLALAGGGEIRMTGQADVVVTTSATGPSIQLVCGEVTVTSTAPARIVSPSGARVASTAGNISVVSEGKTKTIKEGKSDNYGQQVIATVTGPGTTAVISSGMRCHCDCP